MNNLPPLPLIDGCLFIDNSGFMEGVSTCSRYLQYKTLNLRIPTGEKPSLNFGSAIHMALELRYVRYQNKPVDDQYYNDLAALLTQFFSEHPVQSDDWRNLNFAMEMVRKYNEKYDQEEFNLLRYDTPIDCPYCEGFSVTPNEKGGIQAKCLWCSGSGKREIMVEMSFALPLFTHRNSDPIKGVSDEVPVIYSGRIDLPISFRDEIGVLDNKTSSQLGSMFWDEMRMTAQMRGYAWAFNKVTGKDVKAFYVNGIRTKEIPQYVQKGKTFQREGKTSDSKSWWGDTLQREKFYLKPGELKEWEYNTIDLVEEFFWHYSRGYMPMKTKWCTVYGKCPYYDVCQLAPEDRDLYLASGLFSDNVWSPLRQPTQVKQ
jgi:hypothetical protein